MNDEQKSLNELETVLTQLNSTQLGRRAFLASLPWIMAACASDGHRYREGDVSQEKIDMTVQDEQKMTQEAMPDIQKQYPPLQYAELQSYINTLGMKLVRSNGLLGHPYAYSFTVVDVAFVNAFALPAGTIFVTAPLLAMAENEAELAGVVGHEIGHVKARHAAQRIQRQKSQTTKSILFGLGGGLLGGAAGFGAGKLLCSQEDKACLARAAAIGAAAGVGGGLLVQRFAFMANSQEDEMEADRVGFRVATKAGYDKDHVGTFYAKLLRMEEQHQQKNVPILSSVADALSTHPPSRQRVAQMDELCRESHLSAGEVSSKGFDKAKGVAGQWVRDHHPQKG